MNCTKLYSCFYFNILGESFLKITLLSPLRLDSYNGAMQLSQVLCTSQFTSKYAHLHIPTVDWERHWTKRITTGIRNWKYFFSVYLLLSGIMTIPDIHVQVLTEQLLNHCYAEFGAKWERL